MWIYPIHTSWGCAEPLQIRTIQLGIPINRTSSHHFIFCSMVQSNDTLIDDDLKIETVRQLTSLQTLLQIPLKMTNTFKPFNFLTLVQLISHWKSNSPFETPMMQLYSKYKCRTNKISLGSITGSPLSSSYSSK